MSADMGLTTPDEGAGSAFDRVQKDGVLAQFQHVLHRFPVASPTLVLVLSCIVFIFFDNGKFQGAPNIGNTLNQIAVPGCLAIGQTLIILTAGIDLSVGTAMIMCALVAGKLGVDGTNGVVALLIGILVGITLGAVNGLLVTRLKLPPFIVTLGTYYIFNSLGLIYSEAKNFDKKDMPSILSWTGKEIHIGSITITTGVVMMLALFAIFAWVLANTGWGRHVYAIGDDPEAARLAGINVDRVQLSVYMAAGFIYGMAAWIQIGRAGGSSSNAATDVNLITITAVVIGGISLFGGRGLIWGALIGALITQVFNNGLGLAGVNTYYKTLAIGTLIIVAVGLDQWIRRLRK